MWKPALISFRAMKYEIWILLLYLLLLYRKCQEQGFTVTLHGKPLFSLINQPLTNQLKKSLSNQKKIILKSQWNIPTFMKGVRIGEKEDVGVIGNKTIGNGIIGSSLSVRVCHNSVITLGLMNINHSQGLH